MAGCYLGSLQFLHLFSPALEQIRRREGSSRHGCLWTQQPTFVWTATSPHGPGFSHSERAPPWCIFDFKANNLSSLTIPSFWPLSVSRGCTLSMLPEHGQWPFLGFLTQSSGFSFHSIWKTSEAVGGCAPYLAFKRGVRVLFINNSPAQVEAKSQLSFHSQTHPYGQTLKVCGSAGLV